MTPEAFCASIPINSDNLVEGDEIFTVTATPDTLFPSGNIDTITIEDDDGKVLDLHAH